MFTETYDKLPVDTSELWTKPVSFELLVSTGDTYAPEGL